MRGGRISHDDLSNEPNFGRIHLAGQRVHMRIPIEMAKGSQYLSKKLFHEIRKKTKETPVSRNKKHLEFRFLSRRFWICICLMRIRIQHFLSMWIRIRGNSYSSGAELSQRPLTAPFRMVIQSRTYCITSKIIYKNYFTYYQLLS
jgi:hypothetical protein